MSFAQMVAGRTQFNELQPRSYHPCGAFKGRSLGVFTSGGDSQGMNAALRACVRMALYLGCEPYFIREGYQGMVEGGANIVRATWLSVSSIIHRGGTIIGSARCAEFRTRDGRLKAAYNLVSRGINNLVVIGGDGSLTGANILRDEWRELLDKLLERGRITEKQLSTTGYLHVVGIVGTIDNDFYGTEMTIGADSALHRIMEVTDSVMSTAQSHQRAFIVEVMGARCGFLALMTAIGSEADYVFIPEAPPPSDWADQLCNKMLQQRQHGQRSNIIIIAEGAIDSEGNPITAASVKQIVEEKSKMDLRVNVLGHMQRGGNPSSFDRIMASRMGAEATIALMEGEHFSTPVVIGLQNNRIVRRAMMECVKLTNELRSATLAKDWDRVMELRGGMFNTSWQVCKRMMRLVAEPDAEAGGGRCIAVMHMGVPASGMNAAVRAFVINCVHEGYTPLGIYDGVDGLLTGNIKELKWFEVATWVAQSGANLGTKDAFDDEHLADIAACLSKFKIQGLLFIGNFTAYLMCLKLFNERAKYSEFRIPLCMLPATIDNNVPGTDISVGSDTSLNEITDICDRLRQSAQGTRHRVFIVETMGAYCGYLATLSAMAVGADTAYIFEQPLSVETILEDASHMKAKMEAGVQRGLIMCNERASEHYNTEFIHRLYKGKGEDSFSCRMSVLGHIQQSGVPTPFDRGLGVTKGTLSVDWFTKQFGKSEGDFQDDESACVVGMRNGNFVFTALTDLIPESDFKHHLPYKQWWLRLRSLLNILSKYESAYKTQLKSEDETVVQRKASVKIDETNKELSQQPSDPISVLTREREKYRKLSQERPDPISILTEERERERKHALQNFGSISEPTQEKEQGQEIPQPIIGSISELRQEKEQEQEIPQPVIGPISALTLDKEQNTEISQPIIGTISEKGQNTDISKADIGPIREKGQNTDISKADIGPIREKGQNTDISQTEVGPISEETRNDGKHFTAIIELEMTIE